MKCPGCNHPLISVGAAGLGCPQPAGPACVRYLGGALDVLVRFASAVTLEAIAGRLGGAADATVRSLVRRELSRRAATV
jgi:hypothetical protein